jgi:transglutaminase-like putative cysteine protease
MKLGIDTVLGATSRALPVLRAGTSWAVKHVRALGLQIVRGPAEGWMACLLLVLSVLLAMAVVGDAEWVPTPGLYSVALFGVALGLILAKIRRGNPWGLVGSGLVFGLVLAFYQLTSLAEGVTRLERLTEVGNRLFAWWQALLQGGTSSDTLAFSFFVVITSWLVGFISSWFLFRRRSIWGALLPGGVAVVTSLMNVSSTARMFYLHLYLFLAFLLAARLFSLERQAEWQRRGVQHLAGVPAIRWPDAFWLAMVVVLVTSLLPIRAATIQPVAAAWDRMSSPARVIGDEFARVLVGVQGGRPASADYFGPTQLFEGGTALRGEPVLIVEAPVPVYLRARSYDVYTHRGWETGRTRLVSTEMMPEHGISAEFQKLEEVEVMVWDLPSLAAGEPLYVAGYPSALSVSYQLEVLEPVRYGIQVDEDWLSSSLAARYLPADVMEIGYRLVELSSARGGRLTTSDVASVLPEDLWMVGWGGGREAAAVILERRVPVPPDTLSVSSTGSLEAGGSYRSTVLVSAASESDLRTAGLQYPGWVLDRYLQLPDNIPARVIDLALELTSSAEDPYQKAVAIQDYLRSLDYSLEVQTPPAGVDGVDYFLFETGQGYCQYFASAMTVLLRICGVPSRMAVGYGPGEVIDAYAPREGELPADEPESGPLTFIVRNSHSWSEVFFPEYGWIPFEPTPVYPLIVRGGHAPLLPGSGGDGGANPPDQSGGISPLPGDGEGTGIGATWYVRPLAVSLGLALLAAVVWLGWRRLLGEVAEPKVAYARIGYLATLSGLGPSDRLTPYEYGRVLSGAVPDVSADLDAVVDTYVRACYGRSDLTHEEQSRITQAWPRVRNGLLLRAIHGLLPRRFR